MVNSTASLGVQVGLVNIVKNEFFLALLMGAVPAIIIITSQGENEFLKSVNAVTPPVYVMLYFLGLFLVQILLFVRLELHKNSNKIIEGENSKLVFYSLWSQLGFTFFGVFRVMHGASYVILAFSFFSFDTTLLPNLTEKSAIAVGVLLPLTVLCSFLQSKLSK